MEEGWATSLAWLAGQEEEEEEETRDWDVRIRFKLTRQELEQLRPYTLEYTGSRPLSQVKLVLALSVLW